MKVITIGTILNFKLFLQNGSPIEVFVKMARPSRSKAATFVTGTPLPLANKRLAFKEISQNCIKNKPTKRHDSEVNSTILTTPKASYRYNAKRHKIEESLSNLPNQSTVKNQLVDQPEENLEDNKYQEEDLPPPQFFTADLINSCSVM